MKKLRYGAMAVTIAVGVGAFLLAQRLDIVPGPWSPNRPSLISSAKYFFGGDTTPLYVTHYRRGVQFVTARRLDDALTEFDTAVSMRPIPLSLEALGERASNLHAPETHTLHMVVLLHTARADVLERLNRPEEALADLDAALVLDRRKTETMYQRGLLRLTSGRHADAVADFDALLNTRRNMEWYFGRGMAKYLQTDWDGAIADFGAAQRMNPSDQTYLIWLAKSYLRAERAIPPEPFAAMGPNNGARYVIEAFMSDHNPAEFVSGIRAGAAYVDRRRRGIQCETALFAGEWLLVRKKGAGASEMFNEAAASCRPLSIEHAVATAERRRLTP